MSNDNFGAPIKDMRGYMTEQQIKILYEAEDRHDLKTFIRLIWVTGARVSEVLGDHSWYRVSSDNPELRIYEPAKVKNIDFEEGVIILNLLKRKKYPPTKHRVTLDSMTLKILGAYITEYNLSPDNPLFSFSRESAFYYIRKLGEKTGITTVGSKGIHPHHFRHSNCIAYIKRNNTLEGLRKLQQRIGHANIGTTAHYLQFGPEQRQETEDIFGKW